MPSHVSESIRQPVLVLCSPRLTPEEVLRVSGTLKEASSVAEAAAEGILEATSPCSADDPVDRSKVGPKICRKC